jgi:hypothetical protein
MRSQNEDNIAQNEIGRLQTRPSGALIGCAVFALIMFFLFLAFLVWFLY